jgi:crotonobetainyl-CoA:carnitine CoA-transferase CaiB-like acyl-CoA transferase
MDIDTSLFDVALHNLSYPATWFLNAGALTARAPRSAHPSLVPSQLRERLMALLEEILSTRTTAQWLADLAGKVPAAPVHDVAQALASAFVAERNSVAEYAYPDGRRRARTRRAGDGRGHGSGAACGGLLRRAHRRPAYCRRDRLRQMDYAGRLINRHL